MTRRRKLFGPLYWGTLALAGLVVGGLALGEAWPAFRRSRGLRAVSAQLRSKDPLEHRQAAEERIKAGSAGEPWRVDATQDADPRVRLQAVLGLGRTMPLPRGAITALVVRLRDADAHVRRSAADALGRLGPEAATSADALAAGLKDDDPEIRLRAAIALSRMKPRESEPVIRALLALLADRDPTQLPDSEFSAPVHTLHHPIDALRQSPSRVPTSSPRAGECGVDDAGREPRPRVDRS